MPSEVVERKCKEREEKESASHKLPTFLKMRPR